MFLKKSRKESKMDKNLMKQKVKELEKHNYKNLYSHYNRKFEEYSLIPTAITLTRGCSVTMIICCF